MHQQKHTEAENTNPKKVFLFQPFKDKKCRNCFQPLQKNADIYASHTPSGDRVVKCENCNRLNINRRGTSTIELVKRKEEKTLKLKTPITKKNSVVLAISSVALVTGIIGVGVFFLLH